MLTQPLYTDKSALLQAFEFIVLVVVVSQHHRSLNYVGVDIPFTKLHTGRPIWLVGLFGDLV